MAVSALFVTISKKLWEKPIRDIDSENYGSDPPFAYEHWNHCCMGLLMYAGDKGGAATLPKVVGGSGFNAVQAHEILGPLVEPISEPSGSYCWSSSWE